MAYNNFQPQSGYQPQSNYSPQSPQIMTQGVQPLFPQPQGNVYNINSTLEVANVPVGAGISVALCMPENTMFIKTMQNGNPMFYPYKIMPYANEAEQPTQSTEQKVDNNLIEQLQTCNERIAALEDIVKNKKKGVDFSI